MSNIITGTTARSSWQVGICDEGVALIFERAHGKKEIIMLQGDTAERMAAALHGAAREYHRRCVMVAGDVVGRN